MPDTLTPEQVEAIRERLAAHLDGDEAWACPPGHDIAALLADHDALTARAEAAERKVAAVLEDVHATLDEQKGDSDDHHGAHPGAPER